VTPEQALQKIIDGPDTLGCGDSLCAIRRPKGMMTNGGCRCTRFYGLDPEQAQMARDMKYTIQWMKQIARGALNALVSSTN